MGVDNDMGDPCTMEWIRVFIIILVFTRLFRLTICRQSENILLFLGIQTGCYFKDWGELQLIEILEYGDQISWKLGKSMNIFLDGGEMGA